MVPSYVRLRGMAFRRTVALAAVWCVCILPARSTGASGSRLPEAAARAVERVSAADLRSYVERLASDAFAGRGVGDAGNRAAEEFICAIFEKNGVTPAGADGSCYQPFEVYRPALGPRAHLTVSDGNGRTLADLSAGGNFYPLPETGAAAVTAPLVFVNHGISAPQLQHDDYARVNARGAIVLAIESAPADLFRGQGARVDPSALSTVERKAADATAHGARGLIVISGSLSDVTDIWPDHPSVRESNYRRISELKANPMPLATMTTSAAAPLRRALEDGQALTATLTPDLIASPIVIHNVLGIVEGRDRKYRDEMVVVGAHLDHDGTDGEGRIYNGADDNASGTAAVLGAAAAFVRAAADGERPARSVLFALWNAEEKGELGAEAFVESPQPARRTIANLNLDMVGRHEEVPDPNDWRFQGFKKIDPSTSVNTLHVIGYSFSPDLAAEVRDANDAVGLTLLEDYDRGAQDLLHRSDNWPFLAHGIPALFLTTGLHPDYHTPTDDVEKIDFDKLARVTRLAARAAWLAADGREPRMQKK
jgi:peptidase M28-like protein